MTTPTCPHCLAPLPLEANFCPRCGGRLPEATGTTDDDREQLTPRYDVFLLSILATLGLTAVLTLVFHWPVFILGAFLPLLWRRKSKP